MLDPSFSGSEIEPGQSKQMKNDLFFQEEIIKKGKVILNAQ